MAEHRWVLPQTVEAPALTRRLVARACETGCVPQARAADCSLMATELVTNALIHGRGEITLTVGCCQESGSVRVEVRDQGTAGGRELTAESMDLYRETGRGLRIVDALAERWGVDADDSATRAWFEIDRRARRGASRGTIDWTGRTSRARQLRSAGRRPRARRTQPSRSLLASTVRSGVTRLGDGPTTRSGETDVPSAARSETRAAA
jgi:anti-sigma regulatory factor (Ser/Thr protein kinase)